MYIACLSSVYRLPISADLYKHRTMTLNIISLAIIRYTYGRNVVARQHATKVVGHIHAMGFQYVAFIA